MSSPIFPVALSETLTGRYVSRPNRFAVVVRLDGSGAAVNAHLPNPGRMWELLLPNVRLWLLPTTTHTRKTAYTVLAVEREGTPVFLHTHWNNAVAAHLINAGLCPGWRRARVIRQEVPAGSSRFDFLLTHCGEDMLLEVKSCTLFGNGVAMFPDAVTERGRRHLAELAELAERGMRTAVLFLVHTAGVDWFMPDYHTDLRFSRALLDERGRVQVKALAIGWSRRLSIEGAPKPLRIPWRYIEGEARDQGAYLLVLEMEQARRIGVGGLGTLGFKPGWYVYVGSAMRGLDARVARHLRKRKRHKWHIDYLRAVADRCTALPIRSSRREENALATALGKVLEKGPAGFGAGDSPLETHLFFAPEDPLALAAFHDVLQRFRMRVPG